MRRQGTHSLGGAGLRQEPAGRALMFNALRAVTVRAEQTGLASGC